MSSAASTPTSTSFREWMEYLTTPRGAVPEWTWLLREMLTAEFARQRERGFCYAGEVFKDRDTDDPSTAVLPEKRAVKELYHQCRTNAEGVFHIGAEAFWLLGYEWPNQGRDELRRADLVGLNASGGVVVFECKLGDNPYGPFAALLEGLDYLACLTSDSNFAKIQDGFSRWTTRPKTVVPELFQSIRPLSGARHEVIVLAPTEYYDLYSRSERGLGWRPFAEFTTPVPSLLSLRFASSNFTSVEGTWVSG